MGFQLNVFSVCLRRRRLGMNPSEIAMSYDRLADHWNSDAFPRDNGMAQHEQAISFVKNRRRALDVGCGSSGRIIDLLNSSGFDVEGLDISDRMIELARLRHPKATLHHADICEWRMPGRYDLISAWDSIWHVPLANQESVLKKLLNGLNQGGVIIFTTGGVDSPSETVDSAMGPQMYHSALGIPNVLRLLSEAGCICRHLEYDQYPDLHVYLIAQKA